MNEKWLKTYLQNYNETSPEAKELKNFTKTNYKDNVYIPWATMERLMYMQDPDATIEVVKSVDDSLVITSQYTIQSHQKNDAKDINSSADIVHHEIMLEGTFLGKHLFEYYPIQDKAYESPKVIDSNMVNNAIQRGKTRLCSRLTGLGLKLYEGLDLQFPDSKPTTLDPKPMTPEPSPTVEPTVTPTVTPTITPKKTEPKPEVKPEPKAEKATTPLAQYLKDNAETLKIGIQKMNANVVAKYGVENAFDLEKDDVNTIEKKLGNINNPEVFVKAIKAQSGIQ